MTLRRVTAPYLVIALAVAAMELLPGVRTAAQVGDATAGSASAGPRVTVPQPNSLLFYLKILRYDAAERGALLVLSPDRPIAAPESADTPSLGALAHLAGGRVISIGGVTVLAPAQMTIFEGNPGPANPLKDLKPSETFKLLLGTFTRDQWQLACGPNGIGLGDLIDDQRQFFDDILPTEIQIQQSRTSPGPEPGSYTFADTHTTTVTDRQSVRIRLNRKVGLLFTAVGTNNGYMGGPMEYPQGKPFLMMQVGGAYGAYGKQDDRSSAFGVPIVSMVPNRPKRSQIDYDSAVLNPRVSLAGLDDTSTVNDLIARVAAATKLDIVADRRAGALSIYTRGDGARAGDLLRSIALAVTGTYRKVGAKTFVLTNDIEGTGARLTRIAAWADQAAAARRKLIDDALASAAKQNPLDYLAFAPDDPLSVPADLMKQIDAGYHKSRYAGSPNMSAAGLSPALRAEADRDIDFWKKQSGVDLDTGKVQVRMNLSAVYLIPGIGAVPDTYGSLVTGSDSVGSLVTPEESPAKKPLAAQPPTLDWTWLDNPKLNRAILIAPSTSEDVVSPIAQVHERNFNAVWVRVGLQNIEQSRTILTAAISAGRRQAIPVFAVVPLLKDNGLTGDPEQTIAGETGAEFAADYLSQYDSIADHLSDVFMARLHRQTTARYSGWLSPNHDDLLRRVGEIADTPGLAGLVFEATAPPGFIRPLQNYGSAILPGGELGFTDARRLDFLHKQHIDPIDIRPSNLYSLYSLNLSLPFFPDDGQEQHYKPVAGRPVEDSDYRSPQLQWTDSRVAENERLMRDLCAKVRTIRPALPLWMDDRTSDYADASTRWFGTWDDAGRLPRNVVYSDPGTARAAAHSTSATALLGADVDPGDTATDLTAKASFFSRVGARASAQNWNGIVFDFSEVPPDQILHLLTVIPQPTPKP